MTRSDFVALKGEKPPDQASSDLTTVVTIPDGSTIILGGMLKLNQTKGAKKVPLLGDLPLLGGLFRSRSDSDVQRRLYVFVKAEIIRPAGDFGEDMVDLEQHSDTSRRAFEAEERVFQDVPPWPGLRPRKSEPEGVLDAQ